MPPLRMEMMVSIHASRAGGDISAAASGTRWRCFNPRLPRGRRPTSSGPSSGSPAGFNPRLPRGRRRIITIKWPWMLCFNPRLPRGRRQRKERVIALPSNSFQSTPPAREATKNNKEMIASTLFQSTPPAREATQATARGLQAILFSIHASAREATPLLYSVHLGAMVSIHASRAGGDLSTSIYISSPKSFNPRLPRGRRRESARHSRAAPGFQSTPPAREAT